MSGVREIYVLMQESITGEWEPVAAYTDGDQARALAGVRKEGHFVVYEIDLHGEDV
jgi:hypothetical protein